MKHQVTGWFAGPGIRTPEPAEPRTRASSRTSTNEREPANQTLTLPAWPPLVPCPYPGLPGATVERGPRKGLCRYPVELMDDGSARCALHGTVWCMDPNHDHEGSTA